MKKDVESTYSTGQGRQYNQRMKHFKLYQSLLKETDESNYKTMDEITAHFEKMAINTERKSIYKDIEELNIMALMTSEGLSYDDAACELQLHPEKAMIQYRRKRGYHVVHPPLTPEDARLLTECVHTARFVSPQKAEKLVKTICGMVSKNHAQRIMHEPFAVARVKPGNEQVFKNVDLIHVSMQKSKEHAPEKIKFTYLKCTIQNVTKKVDRRHGEEYVVSPHAIMINEGNYYLLGVDEKGKLRTYRIDRMRYVKLTGEPREGTEETENLKGYLSDYYSRVFSMYGGRCEFVRIRFTNDLLDTVVDRFGRYASFSEDDSRHFIVSLKVEVSPMFFGWLCGFGNKAKLLSPSSVIEEFTKHLAKMQELYQN